MDAGGDVAITVTTKPNAFVGLLAVDQRALMLGTHNHFSQVSHSHAPLIYSTVIVDVKAILVIIFAALLGNLYDTN